MRTKHKFVKIMNQLYRTEDGQYTIMRNHEFVAVRLKWKVLFTNMFGEKVVRKFYTLAAAKEYINNPGTY